MQKFYMTPQGDFIGSFDGAEPPEGSVVVPMDHLPENGAQKFKGGAWSAYTPEKPITAKELSDALAQKGIISETEVQTLKVK